MVDEITRLQQEAEKLRQELESEKFKRDYSDELIQQEKVKTREQQEKYDHSLTEITELRAQIETQKTGKIKGINFSDDSEMRKLKEDVNQLELELEASKNTNKQLEEQVKRWKLTEDQSSVTGSTKRISELMKANQQLKTELALTQQSVGEVMLIAQQQANGMIEEATHKATQTIEMAQQNLFDIGFKANQLSKEVKDSQIKVNEVYADLIHQLVVLAEKDYSS